MRTVLLLLSLFGVDSLRRGTSITKATDIIKATDGSGEITGAYDPLTVIGMIVDGVGLLLRMFKDELKCLPWGSFIFWNIWGALVMTQEQDLTLEDAVMVLGQQFTSVGYGSSPPESNGLKAFHNLHALWAVTEFTDLTNTVMNQFFGYRILMNIMYKACGRHVFQTNGPMRAKQSTLGCTPAHGLDSLRKYTVWFISVSGFTLLFGLGGGMSGKNHILDALYMVGMTLTTVGYGDLTPDETWSKWLSYPFMTYMTWLTGISFSDGKTLFAAADLNGDYHRDDKGAKDGSYKAGCFLDFQPDTLPEAVRPWATFAAKSADNIGKPIGNMILKLWNMIPASPNLNKFLNRVGLPGA